MSTPTKLKEEKEEPMEEMPFFVNLGGNIYMNTGAGTVMLPQ